MSDPPCQHQTFTDCAEAEAYVATLDYSVVVKASGLAAGKGVLIPTTKEGALRPQPHYNHVKDTVGHARRIRENPLRYGFDCPYPTETVAALRTVMVERAFGDAGEECVVEECLTVSGAATVVSPYREMRFRVLSRVVKLQLRYISECCGAGRGQSARFWRSAMARPLFACRELRC
jgi:hypothetical protein